MTRVCLIQCTGGEGGRLDAPPLSTYNLAEPLGLLCLDAWLRREQNEVLLLHPHIKEGGVLSDAEMFTSTVSFQPDLIGFSAMTNQVPATALLAKALKRCIPKVPIVIGGDHFSSRPNDLALYEMFDFAVCGEGESALPWLLENAHLSPSTRCPAPTGIYWRENGAIRGSGRTERINHLGLLPPATRYSSLLGRSEVGMLMWPPPEHQTGMISLYASRGCPYSCSYCNARLVWGKGVEWRDPVSIVGEMREARDKHGVNTAFFVDLTFNANLGYTRTLCEAIARANLGVSWYVLVRPGNPVDRIRVDRALLESMQSAGCVKIGFGVETFSPTVARSLRRVCSNEYVVQLARWMDEIGIISKAFLMIGHPAEDEDYFNYLFEHLEKLSVDEIRLSFLTPFPGTPLWEAHKHELPGPNEYDKFTTFRPILPHPKLTPGHLEEVRLRLLRHYYSSSNYRARIKEKIKVHPQFKGSFDVFHQNVELELGSIRDCASRHRYDNVVHSNESLHV